MQEAAITGEKCGTLIAVRESSIPGYCVLAMPLVAWAVLALGYLTAGNGLSPDSASYIECAKSIEAGRGLQVRPFAGLERRLWQALDCFPPGYPLLTVGLMRVGVADAYCAARAVAVGCSFLFLLLVLLFYGRTLPSGIAAMVGMGLACTSPMLTYETMCLSEGPYMLLAAVSLLSLLRGTRHCSMSGAASLRDLLWIFVAGLAGGCAWSVRNVGIALLAASIAYLLCQAHGRRIGGFAVAVGAWLTGWFSGNGWVIVWNVCTFGSFSPYRVPTRALPSGLVTAVAVAGVAAGVAVLLGWRRLIGFARKRPAECLLGGFLFFHVGAVIMAHCVYQMGESVRSFRFYAPVYWIGLWLAALGARRLCGWLPVAVWRAGAVLAAGAVVFAVIDAARPVLPEAWASDAVLRLAEKRGGPDREAVARLARAIPKDKLVLADRVEELRVFGDVNARRLPDVKYGQAPLTRAELDSAGKDGRLWGIAVWEKDRFAQGRYGSALRDLVLTPGRVPEFQNVEAGGEMSVWKFVP
ncbi:MAG: hypothetical protein LLG00_03565 [Planctomycetaceae bacterium]|nr:hypothetical protein [Planctomycetaceae bacterium]